MKELIFKAGQKVRETEMEASSPYSEYWAAPPLSRCGRGQVIGQVIAGLKHISINQKRGVKLQSGVYYISYTTRREEPAATAVLGFRRWYTVLCACFAFLA